MLVAAAILSRKCTLPQFWWLGSLAGTRPTAMRFSSCDRAVPFAIADARSSAHLRLGEFAVVDDP